MKDPLASIRADAARLLETAHGLLDGTGLALQPNDRYELDIWSRLAAPAASTGAMPFLRWRPSDMLVLRLRKGSTVRATCGQ